MLRYKLILVFDELVISKIKHFEKISLENANSEVRVVCFLFPRGTFFVEKRFLYPLFCTQILPTSYPTLSNWLTVINSQCLHYINCHYMFSILAISFPLIQKFPDFTQISWFYLLSLPILAISFFSPDCIRDCISLRHYILRLHFFPPLQIAIASRDRRFTDRRFTERKFTDRRFSSINNTDRRFTDLHLLHFSSTILSLRDIFSLSRRFTDRRFNHRT